MSDVHSYRTTARWRAHRSGEVEAEGGPRALPFSAPPEFHGEPNHWSPETLLVAAASSCFLTTLVAIAEFSKLELADVEVSGEAKVERVPGRGYNLTELVLLPAVSLAREADREKLEKALKKAEQNCIVARALQVPVRVEPSVEAVSEAKGA